MPDNKLANFNPNPKKVKEAQNALILAKGNQAEASRISGISRPTFKRYLKHGLIDPSIKLDGADNLQSLEKLTSDRNAKLAEAMMGTAEKARVQADSMLVDASAKDAAVVMGVMIEKARLVQGQATKKVEIDVGGSIEVLKRHGLLIEDDSNVIDGEVVDPLEIEA